MNTSLGYDGPEMIADYNCEVGEGVLWHSDEKRVYWTDIPTGRMFRLDPSSGKHAQFYNGEIIGGFTIQADGSLLLFIEKGGIKSYRHGELQTLIPKIPGEELSRFNDVIADPKGRVFCGTMPTEDRPGRLYRLDPDGQINLLLEELDIPNGLGFTPDENGLYFTETGEGKIHLFDYDQSTGKISGKRTFVYLKDEQGGPDGMTVDSEGCIWSALWDGGCIVRYTPEGKETARIELPAKKVTSLTFGGEDYSDLYVTTAGGNNKAQEGEGAGALFRINFTSLEGSEEYRSRIHISS